MVLTAETIQQIVEQIYMQTDLWQVCRHYSPHFFEDIKHEIVLQLFNKDNAKKIMELYQLGMLKYYIISIIKNSAFSNSSDFYRKYKKIPEQKDILNIYVVSNDHKSINKRIKEERIYDEARNTCCGEEKNEKRKFILRTIFELYFENQLSIRQIAKCSNLSPSTIFNYLKEIKQNIINKVTYDNN